MACCLENPMFTRHCILYLFFSEENTSALAATVSPASFWGGRVSIDITRAFSKSSSASGSCGSVSFVSSFDPSFVFSTFSWSVWSSFPDSSCFLWTSSSFRLAGGFSRDKAIARWRFSSSFWLTIAKSRETASSSSWESANSSSKRASKRVSSDLQSSIAFGWLLLHWQSLPLTATWSL